MGCNHAIEQRRGWMCSITGGKCIFMVPDLSICSMMYGDEPDALYQAEEQDDELDW